MRILLITHYYRPEIGAPQRRWDALVDRFIRAGHEVAVLAPGPHYPDGRLTSRRPTEQPGAIARGERGEMVHRLPFHEYGSGIGDRGADQLLTAAAAVVRGLTRFSSSHRPDVIVATVPGLPTLPAGIILGACLRRPVVLEMRDAWPDLLQTRDDWDGTGSMRHRSSTSRWRTTALTAAVTALQRRAAAIVTTTETFAEVLRGRGMRRVTTVRHGTAAAEAPPLTLSTARRLRVLYAGTVGRSQGLESAIEAASICAERGTQVDLRIVGSGAQLDYLRSFANDLSAPVTFLPTVAPTQMTNHYAWADSILVSLRSWTPLRWTVPSKLYDALATGRHISAALDGEAAAVIERNEAGDVVPPEQPHALAALWETLSAHPERLQVGTQGRAWVTQNADDDALADRYVDLLEEVRSVG